MITLFQLLFHLITACIVSEQNRYHLFDDLSGYVLATCKLLYFSYFLYGILSFVNKGSKKRVQTFLRTLGVLGGVFLLAFPCCFLLSFACKKYYRFNLMIFGNTFLQLISMLVLGHLLT